MVVVLILIKQLDSSYLFFHERRVGVEGQIKRTTPNMSRLVLNRYKTCSDITTFKLLHYSIKLYLIVARMN